MICKSVQAESLQRVVLSAEMYERVGSESSMHLDRISAEDCPECGDV